MKGIHIEFVAPVGWLRIWLAAGLLVTAAVGATAWACWRTQQETAGAAGRNAALIAEIAKLRTAESGLTNPKGPSMLAAAHILSLDLNKAFGSIENMKVDGARLRSFNLDTTADVLRLEFELDASDRGSEITTALNAGYESRPWKLETISGSGLSTGSVALVPSASYRGSWFARMKSL